MLNDAPPIPTNQPEPAETDDIDLSDLPPLIDSNPNPSMPPHHRCLFSTRPIPRIMHQLLFPCRTSLTMGVGCIPCGSNELEKPHVRMITDNIGAQCAPKER